MNDVAQTGKIRYSNIRDYYKYTGQRPAGDQCSQFGTGVLDFFSHDSPLHGDADYLAARGLFGGTLSLRQTARLHSNKRVKTTEKSQATDQKRSRTEQLRCVLFVGSNNNIGHFGNGPFTRSQTFTLSRQKQTNRHRSFQEEALHGLRL